MSNSFKAIISDPDRAGRRQFSVIVLNSLVHRLALLEILPYLQQLSYQQPQELAALLDDFYQSRAVQASGKPCRAPAWKSLMPRLLEACADRENNSKPSCAYWALFSGYCGAAPIWLCW